MRKRSIRTRIILLTTMGILISVILIGGIGIYSFKQGMDQNSEDILYLTCGEKGQELDEWFVRIEQSVETLAKYTLKNMESVDRLLNDEEYRVQYAQALEDLALMLADETDGAVSVYVRFNPELTSPLDGVFWVKTDTSMGFHSYPMTDLSAYDEDDVEHVGWYYIPVRAGHPIWVEPYMNKEMDMYVTSYVVPIYSEGTLLGVVGMDIEFLYIMKMVDEICLYDTGHAFLTDSKFRVTYSKHLPKGDKVEILMDAVPEGTADIEKVVYYHIHNGIKRRLVFRRLENDMCLAVTVPVYEVEKSTTELIVQVVGLAMMIVLVFVLVTVVIVGRIIRPLLELNEAAKEIAAGNLNIAVDCHTGDEVEMLAESFSETARQLKTRIDYINSLAFNDKLTGVRNNTAYLRELAQLREKIQGEAVEFAVFVIDVNGLKQVNDTLGHAAGNELIIKAADSAVEVFGKENVFRIGGDEFAVIYPKADAALCAKLKQGFEETVARLGEEIHLSAAIGSAQFDPALDKGYETVFERADSEMYQRKQELKGGAACR